jgi:uncharacterized protein
LILTSHFILYVDDQQKSTEFYTRLLEKQPRLIAPGMTEFDLAEHTVLGLMTRTGIRNLLKDALPSTEFPSGLLRAELYLMVDDPATYYQRALLLGAKNVSALGARDWGHIAAYCLDLDGHVLAFAQPMDK